MKIHKHIRHVKRLHKIKVHKNRWLVWAFFAALAAGVALVGYIKVSDVDFENQVFNYSDTKLWRTYSDGRLGFSLKYPMNWGIEAMGEGIEFSDTSNPQNNVTVFVYDASAERSIRQSLNIEKEEKIRIDSVEGRRIENAITSKVMEDVVLIKSGDRLYVIRGSGNMFDKVVTSFNFLP